MRSSKHAVLAGLVVLLAGCGGEGTSTTASTPRAGGDFSPIIARVGDVEITQGYFDYRYKNVSAADKARFSGEDWRMRFMDMLVEEMVISEKAQEENLQLVRENEWRLDLARRSILFKAYFERDFEDRLEIPEVEIREYYENYKDTFTGLGRMLGQHVQSTSKEVIDKAWEELEGGENFSVVAGRYSEDPLTNRKDGTLGWFNPDGYVLGIGFNSEFTNFAFSIPTGTIAPPKKFGENWHIIRSAQKTDAEQQSFEQARDRIERQLRPRLQREAYEQRIKELKAEYDVRYFGEFDVKESRDADQLYRLAAESLSPHSKLGYYEKLVELYPEHARADDALFMIGFVCSEEIGEVGRAATAFHRLGRDYPDSDFADDAKWMLGNLGGRNPQLNEAGIPRGADEISGRIDSLRD